MALFHVRDCWSNPLSSQPKVVVQMTNQSITKFEVNYNGIALLMDVADGKMMSLNAIYAAAGSPANKDAPAWLRNSDVAAFMLTTVGEKSSDFKHLAETHLTQRPEKKEKSKELVNWCNAAYSLAVQAGLVMTKRGKYGGGTWAHWKIATKYAAYLEPALESAILDVFRERIQEEIDPGKAVDRGIKGYRKQGRSDTWIDQRVKSKLSWTSLTDVLKEHEVTKYGYARCADSLNVPIVGDTAKVVKREQGLKKHDSLRDIQDEVTLALMNVAQVLSKDKIVKDNRIGDMDCSRVCFDVATRVAALRS